MLSPVDLVGFSFDLMVDAKTMSLSPFLLLYGTVHLSNMLDLTEGHGPAKLAIYASSGGYE